MKLICVRGEAVITLHATANDKKFNNSTYAVQG